MAENCAPTMPDNTLPAAPAYVWGLRLRPLIVNAVMERLDQ